MLFILPWKNKSLIYSIKDVSHYLGILLTLKTGFRAVAQLDNCYKATPQKQSAACSKLKESSRQAFPSPTYKTHNNSLCTDQVCLCKDRLQ